MLKSIASGQKIGKYHCQNSHFDFKIDTIWVYVLHYIEAQNLKHIILGIYSSGLVVIFIVYSMFLIYNFIIYKHTHFTLLHKIFNNYLRSWSKSINTVITIILKNQLLTKLNKASYNRISSNRISRSIPV